MTDSSPIKIKNSTKQLVRLGAAMQNTTQRDFVDLAVNEFLENHKDELKEKLEYTKRMLLI